MASIIGLSILDRIRLGSALDLRNPALATAGEWVTALQRAVKRQPTEWVLYYMLGDKLQQVGAYVDALSACQRCVEIRPDDLKSVYALATAYNMLTRAKWEAQKEMEVLRALQALIGPARDRLDPILSQAALDKLNMVVDTAAAQAIRWFEKCLLLRPDAVSRQQIQQDLTTLYSRFPHLQK